MDGEITSENKTKQKSNRKRAANASVLYSFPLDKLASPLGASI